MKILVDKDILGSQYNNWCEIIKIYDESSIIVSNCGTASLHRITVKQIKGVQIGKDGKANIAILFKDASFTVNKRN